MNLHTFSLSSLNSEYIFSSLVQSLFLLLLYNLTTSLLVFSHLLSFQKYEFTCEIFEKLISWPFLQIFLLLSSHSKSPILLPSSSSLLFFLFLIFSFYFLLSSSSSSSFLLIFFSSSSLDTLLSSILQSILGL